MKRWPLFLVVAAGFLACASPSSGKSGDAGTPDASGSAPDAGGGPTTCATADRICAHVFSYSGDATSVSVRGTFTSPPWTVDVPMAQTNGGPWTATVSLDWGSTVLYKFVLNGQTWIADPTNPDQVPDGYGGMNSQLQGVTCDAYTCTTSSEGTPDGGTPTDGGTTGLGPFDWRDAVLYFTLTDRFVDGDHGNDGQPIEGVETPEAYQGGDWAGITQKIDSGYFDDLGVNVIWISPPTMGPSDAWPSDEGPLVTGYHGYWPYDLTKPDPHFGTMDDLKKLVSHAHQHGIRIMLDYAMHHVIQTAPLYAQNPSWFWPLANQGQSQCVCGKGCSWDGQQGIECWFTPYLPAFNYTDVSQARDYTVDNALWWVQQSGADALRLDAVKQIDQSWLTELRSKLGSQFYLIGETFSGDHGVVSQYVNPSELDGQFDFSLRAQIVSNVLIRQGSMQDLDNFLSSDLGSYGSQAVMGDFIGNHDVPRAIEFADDTPAWTDPWALGKERAWNNQPQLPSDAAPFQRLGNAFVVIFTIPGMPMIYYGDEIGMNGAGDPDNRHMMVWTGYSDAQKALLAEVQKLGKIRAAHSALRRGNRTSLWATTDVLVYQMADGSDTVDVAINRSDSQQSASGLPNGPLTDQLTGNQVTGPTIQLPPRSAMVLTP